MGTIDRIDVLVNTRKMKALSLSDLSKLSGVSIPTLSKIENRVGNCKDSTIVKVEIALGLKSL